MDSGSLDSGRLARLLEAGRSLVAEREPDGVLIRVLEVARELTGAQYAAIGILDEEKRGLARFLTAGIDDELRQRIGPLPRGHGILGELIRDPQPLRLARISEHARSYGFPAEHPEMETFLGVPVMIRGEVYGNLYLTEKAEGAEFSAEDEDLLVVLADWAAVAIDNARAHAASRRNQLDLKRAMRGLEASASLNREVVVGADPDRVNELVVKRSRALSDARSAALLLLGDQGLQVAARAGETADQDAAAITSLSTDVLRSGRGQVLSPTVASRLRERSAGGVIVPLRTRGVDLGVLVVLDRIEEGAAFSGDDVVTLEAFATSAAAAIGAAQALEDERVRMSITSSERERQRWARELHDETLQELGALNVMQETALQTDDPSRIKATLERSRDQVELIISSLQGLITELRPAALDQLGIEAALDALLERLRERSELDVSLDVDLAYESGRTRSRPAPELEGTVYSRVQEALTNVIKHAGATRARVRVEETERAISVTVEDDGSGFDQALAHGGYGLIGMRERVALQGGELKIAAALDGGTRVSASLPLERVRDPADEAG